MMWNLGTLQACVRALRVDILAHMKIDVILGSPLLPLILRHSA